MCSEEEKGLEGMSGLEKRRMRGNLIAFYSFLTGACGQGGAELFSLSSPWYPAIGRVRIVQSCTKGGLDWTLGSISLLRG